MNQGLGIFLSHDIQSPSCNIHDACHLTLFSHFSQTQASSEENLHLTGGTDSFLGQKSFSAEILMARPREHFHSRFLDLDEKDKNRKPFVVIPSPCDDEDESNDPKKCHRRVTSDVVKTEENLNYSSIIRDSSKQVFVL